MFYKTSTKNWHVVLSAGDGMCYSTDVGGRGKVGYLSIKSLASSWNITLLGWTEDLNGFTVYKPAASAPKPLKPAKPRSKPKLVSKVSVEDLKKARNTDPKKGSRLLASSQIRSLRLRPHWPRPSGLTRTWLMVTMVHLP